MVEDASASSSMALRRVIVFHRHRANARLPCLIDFLHFLMIIACLIFVVASQLFVGAYSTIGSQVRIQYELFIAAHSPSPNTTLHFHDFQRKIRLVVGGYLGCRSQSDIFFFEIAAD